MTLAIVDNINRSCSCSFTKKSVLYSSFQCFDSNSDSVTFRGGLRGLVDVNSTVLAGYVVAWVKSEDNMTLQGVQYQFDSDCLDKVLIEDIQGPECAPTAEVDGLSGSLNTGEAFAVAVVIVLVVGAVVTTLVLIICLRYCNLLT